MKIENDLFFDINNPSFNPILFGLFRLEIKIGIINKFLELGMI